MESCRSVLCFSNGFLLPLLSLSSLLSLSTSHLLPTTTSQMSYRVTVIGTRNQVHLAVLAEQALKNFNEVQQQPPFSVRAGSLPLAIYFGEHSPILRRMFRLPNTSPHRWRRTQSLFRYLVKRHQNRNQLESLEAQLRLQVPIDQQVSCNSVRASVGRNQSEIFSFLFSSDVRSHVARGHGGSTAHSIGTPYTGGGLQSYQDHCGSRCSYTSILDFNKRKLQSPSVNDAKHSDRIPSLSRM